jgi:uncharacterized RDD family membrane protein YckC
VFFYTDSPETRSIIAAANEMVAALLLGIFLAANVETRVSRAAASAFMVAYVAGYLAYLVVMPVLLGGTLAQRLFGVRIVSDDAARPTYSQSLVRLGCILAEGVLCMTTGPVGFVVLLLARRRGQRWWHDKRAGTRIVFEPDRLRR